MSHTADRSPRHAPQHATAPTQRARHNEAGPHALASSPRETAQRQRIAAAFGPAVQRVEDEELLQGRFLAAQRMEEEEALQGRFQTLQRMEEEEPLQGRFLAVQRASPEEELPAQGKGLNTTQAGGGLPASLKAGVEALSGVSMDGVQVHYNSSKPAQLNALAYAQGSDIHIAPGQEQHLPHEAWHIAQQAQGRVQANTQAGGGVPVNDNPALEHEADVMGAQALSAPVQQQLAAAPAAQLATAVAQLERFDAGTGGEWHIHKGHIKLGRSTDSRVEFNGRSAKEIRAELGEKINRFGLAVGGNLAASFRACIDWINENC